MDLWSGCCLYSKTMARPIYIGVYGHPRYEQSVYMMSAEVLPENVDEVDAFMNIKEDERQKASFKYKTDDNVENSEAPEFESIISTGIYWLLELLIDILTLL